VGATLIVAITISDATTPVTVSAFDVPPPDQVTVPAYFTICDGAIPEARFVRATDPAALAINAVNVHEEAVPVLAETAPVDVFTKRQPIAYPAVPLGALEPEHRVTFPLPLTARVVTVLVLYAPAHLRNPMDSSSQKAIVTS
jgi:hypothetical protein